MKGYITGNGYWNLKPLARGTLDVSATYSMSMDYGREGALGIARVDCCVFAIYGSIANPFSSLRKPDYLLHGDFTSRPLSACCSHRLGKPRTQWQ